MGGQMKGTLRLEGVDAIEHSVTDAGQEWVGGLHDGLFIGHVRDCNGFVELRTVCMCRESIRGDFGAEKAADGEH